MVVMPSLPEHCGGFQGKDQTAGRPRYPCNWEADIGEMVYRSLVDDAREGVCDRMSVSNATNELGLSPPDSGSGGAADDVSE